MKCLIFISGTYIRITMTYPLLLCMTLVVMVSGYERYMPGPSKQLTKADIDYMTDTKTLKAILAKLMKIHVQEDSVVQGTYTYTYTYIRTYSYKYRIVYAHMHVHIRSYEYMYRRIVYAHMHVHTATSTCTGG